MAQGKERLETMAIISILYVDGIHTLLYIYIYIYMFLDLHRLEKCHFELVKLMDAFKSNGYPLNLISNCFKVSLDTNIEYKKK